MSFYSPQLDGLRFIAALLVFFHHAPEIAGLSVLKEYGWVGVDLFLCISAFLLTRLLRLEFHDTGNISVRKFYIRRALRIWPLYFGFATLASVYAIYVGSPSVGATFIWWLSHFTFTNNLLTAFLGYSPVAYSAHLWTISLEEQAYLGLPFVLLVFCRKDLSISDMLRRILMAIAALLMIRTAFYLFHAPHPIVWVLPIRGDAFLVGMATALVLEKYDAKLSLLLASIGIALLLSVMLFPPVNEHGSYQIVGYTVTALGCGLIVAASQSKYGRYAFLTWRPLIFLGKASYGFYVFHFVTLAVAGEIGSWTAVSSPLGIAMLGLVLTIAVASLSYLYFERPFLRLKSRFTVVVSRPD